MRIVTGGIGELPLYNDDLRAAGYPPAVARLREQVRNADALLFVTPEYNYPIPGVLKNAIDRVSRPPDQPFAGEPAAIMGARAQYHLRQVGVFLDLQFLNRPEVMIAHAADRFDENGRLAHAPTREFVRALLLALREWTLRLRA